MALLFLLLAAWCSALQAQSLADGIAAVESGRLDEAKRILSGIVQKTPDSFDANFYLGLTLYRAGDLAAARPLLERAVSLSPSNAGAWKTLGVTIWNLKNLEGALPAFSKACVLAPTDWEGCYYFAVNEYQLGHYEAAR